MRRKLKHAGIQHLPLERLDESTPEYTWKALCGEIVPGTQISISFWGSQACEACRAEYDRQSLLVFPPASVTSSYVVQYIAFGSGGQWGDADFGERRGYDTIEGAYGCIDQNKAEWAGWAGSRFGNTGPQGYRVIWREIAETIITPQETLDREVTFPSLRSVISKVAGDLQGEGEIA